MALYRIQMSMFTAGALQRDWCTNTLYLNSTAVPPAADPDLDALLDDVMDAYDNVSILALRHYDIRAYDMADAEPREVKSHRTRDGSDSAPGPREVALCLSYFADRNVKSKRGRIYLGPFVASVTAHERPPSGAPDELLDLASDLWNVGGVDIDWSIYSPKNNDHTRINHVWVDDEWDTIRSRGLRATTRVTRDGDG